jgi:hypothetical protein
VERAPGNATRVLADPQGTTQEESDVGSPCKLAQGHAGVHEISQENAEALLIQVHMETCSIRERERERERKRDRERDRNRERHRETPRQRQRERERERYRDRERERKSEREKERARERAYREKERDR